MIHLNCDIGEGLGNESLLIPFLSSCSIACGGHAGDATSIDEVLRLTVGHDLTVGAHPSFPDRENFGRAAMQLSIPALQETLREQLGLMHERSGRLHVKIEHVKAHGALYIALSKDSEMAQSFVAVAREIFPEAKIYAPFQSVLASVALENECEVVYEAFADRNYNDDLSLVSRESKSALVKDPGKILKHLISLYHDSVVTTVTGKELTLCESTFCVHGDNPNVLSILKNIRRHPKLNAV